MKVSEDGKEIALDVTTPSGTVVTIKGWTSSDDKAAQERLKKAALELAGSIKDAKAKD